MQHGSHRNLQVDHAFFSAAFFAAHLALATAAIFFRAAAETVRFPVGSIPTDLPGFRPGLRPCFLPLFGVIPSSALIAVFSLSRSAMSSFRTSSIPLV
jgi:hypothetical protein